MNKKKVSIIIPIYNASKYLTDLFKSIDEQNYDNYEVLLINDGSTDKTESICLEYKNRKSNIKYYKKKNTGVSDTRNFGIQKATGEYICFIDADDILSKTYIKDLVETIEYNNAELGCCDYIEFKELMEINNIDNKKTKIEIYNKEKYNIIFSKYKGYLWNKIFIKKIIEEEKLEFNSQIAMAEDMLFVFEYLKYINKIAINSNKNYYYRIVDNSMSKNITTPKWYSIYNTYDKLFYEKIDDKEYNQNLSYSYVYYLYQGLFRIKFLSDKNMRIKLLSETKRRIKKSKYLIKKMNHKQIIKIILYMFFSKQIFNYKYKRR